MKNKSLLIIFVIVLALFIWTQSTKSEDTTSSSSVPREPVEFDTQEYIADVYSKAYDDGFEEGYNLAEYEHKAEAERFNREYISSDEAYDLGYDAGYDAGYWDAMDEMGLDQNHGYAKIEKDK